MGDLIKKIGEIRLGGGTLDVELNHSVHHPDFREVHLQNKKFRFELPENEFLSMAACVLLAREQFDEIKGRKHGKE